MYRAKDTACLDGEGISGRAGGDSCKGSESGRAVSGVRIDSPSMSGTDEEQERKNQLLVSERDKANAEEQAVKVRGKLEFPEKAEAEQKIKELEKRKKEMDKNLDVAQKAFRECSQTVEAAKTKKKTLKIQSI